MALTDFPSGPGWIVTGQDPDQVIVTPGGRAVTGVYIYIATGEGNTASVFVDDATYVRVPDVRKILAARAKLVDEIGRLGTAQRQG